jgi:hypothetical protein
MQVPGFLRKDRIHERGLPEEGDDRRSGYAVRGCLLGSILAILFWFVPLPVVGVVWVLGLKDPFSDYMLIAIPFFIALPLVGAAVGGLAFRKRLARRKR